MARKCFFEKMKKEPKFEVRKRNRCWRCGRPRGYLRKFGI
ncbi:MAG TPA: type Z 30S ribosomal protein S14, partial [bacterium]|nr:type Z 30S ribosomal protein S14 [bacterium]